MTEAEWRDYLLQVAECGSDVLRDTWVTIPTEIQDVLAFTLREAGIIAMAADMEIKGP